MMYVACAGEIIDVSQHKIKIRTNPDNEEYDAFMEGDGVFDIKKGDTGIFVGKLTGNAFVLEKVELRKLLDPLYQKNLLTNSSAMQLVPVLQDPFPKYFKSYADLEEVKLREIKEAEEKRKEEEEREEERRIAREEREVKKRVKENADKG